MGQFLFDVPPEATDFVSQSLWKDAYICGLEGVPWQSHQEFDGERLTLTRTIGSSGKLFMACPIEGLGFRTLSTCSLKSVPEPHLLPLELARGSCFRARVQSDVWQRSGLTLSQKFTDLVKEGTGHFLTAAQNRANPGVSTESALKALQVLETAIEDLGESYAVQSISFRKQHEPQIGTLLAGTVVPPSPSDSPHAEQFRAAFNSASVRLSWADIETDAGRYDFDHASESIKWCATHGLRVIGGPLLDFRERLLPHWLYLLEDDFEALLNAVISFAEKTVAQFRGSIHLWNCAAGLNTPGPLKLKDEEIMRLAVGVLQVVRRNDPNTPAVVSFDQPFGEYLAHYRDGISPLHFADALARSGLGMAGLGLDVRFNYASDSTLPRSAVDFGQMIDRWATLGMPLLVQFTVPGGKGADTNAQAPADILGSEFYHSDPAGSQLRIAAPIIRTLLAKHIVHGVVWDGWSDAEPHVSSHSGILDASGNARPILDYFIRLRRDFLA